MKLHPPPPLFLLSHLCHGTTSLATPLAPFSGYLATHIRSTGFVSLIDLAVTTCVSLSLTSRVYFQRSTNLILVSEGGGEKEGEGREKKRKRGRERERGRSSNSTWLTSPNEGEAHFETKWNENRKLKKKQKMYKIFCANFVTHPPTPPPPLAPPDQLPRLPHLPPTSSAATFQLCAKAKTSQLLRQLFNLARGGAQKEGAVSSTAGGGGGAGF